MQLPSNVNGLKWVNNKLVIIYNKLNQTYTLFSSCQTPSVCFSFIYLNSFCCYLFLSQTLCFLSWCRSPSVSYFVSPGWYPLLVPCILWSHSFVSCSCYVEIKILLIQHFHLVYVCIWVLPPSLLPLTLSLTISLHLPLTSPSPFFPSKPTDSKVKCSHIPKS